MHCTGGDERNLISLMFRMNNFTKNIPTARAQAEACMLMDHEERELEASYCSRSRNNSDLNELVQTSKPFIQFPSSVSRLCTLDVLSSNQNKAYYAVENT